MTIFINTKEFGYDFLKITNSLNSFEGSFIARRYKNLKELKINDKITIKTKKDKRLVDSNVESILRNNEKTVLAGRFYNKSLFGFNFEKSYQFDENTGLVDILKSIIPNITIKGGLKTKISNSITVLKNDVPRLVFNKLLQNVVFYFDSKELVILDNFELKNEHLELGINIIESEVYENLSFEKKDVFLQTSDFDNLESKSFVSKNKDSLHIEKYILTNNVNQNVKNYNLKSWHYKCKIFANVDFELGKRYKIVDKKLDIKKVLILVSYSLKIDINESYYILIFGKDL